MTSTMTSSTTTTPATAGERRLRGLGLSGGALVIAVLLEGHVLPYYWLPALTSLTYLTATAVSRSRGTLGAPGFIVTSVGVAVALWLRSGRPVDSFEFLALAVMSLGLGGVLAAGIGQVRGWIVTPMSVALSVLLFGAFLLLEQQGIKPVAGHAWVYVVLLGLWGACELRPARQP